MVTLLALKNGALLHVLVGLLVYGPCRKETLKKKTGWSDEAIQDALEVLSDPDMNLAVALPSGRWPLWDLTFKARQLFLPADSDRLLSRADHDLLVTPLGAESARGSSCLTNESSNNKDSTTTTTDLTPLAAESPIKTPGDYLARPIDLLVQMLVETGASRERSTSAVAAALNRGETVEAITRKVLDGQAYRKTKAGRSIHTPYWLVACIEDGRAIPEQAPRPEQLDIQSYDGYVAEAPDEP